MNIADFTKGLTENLNRIAKKEKEQFHLTDDQIRKLAEFYDLKDGPDTPDHINVEPFDVYDSDIREAFGNVEMFRHEYIRATRNAIISTLSKTPWHLINKGEKFRFAFEDVIPAKAGIHLASRDSSFRWNDGQNVVLLGAGALVMTQADVMSMPALPEMFPSINSLTPAGTVAAVVGMGIVLDQFLINPGLRRELGGYDAYQQAVEAASPSMVFTVGAYSAEPVTLEPLAMSAPASGTGGNGTPPPPPTETDPNPPEEEPKPEPKDDGLTESRRELARVRRQTPDERRECRKIAARQIAKINKILKKRKLSGTHRNALEKLRGYLTDLQFSSTLLARTNISIEVYSRGKHGALPPSVVELNALLKSVRRDSSNGTVDEVYIQTTPSESHRVDVRRYNDLVREINFGNTGRAAELKAQIDLLLDSPAPSRYIRQAMCRMRITLRLLAEDAVTPPEATANFASALAKIQTRFPESSYETFTPGQPPIRPKPAQLERIALRQGSINATVTRECKKRDYDGPRTERVRQQAHLLAKYAAASDTVSGIVRKAIDQTK